MDDIDLLAERFEARRGHLHAVAYRMLGSRSEAEDAVQEAWLRLGRSGAVGVENLGGWLTLKVAAASSDADRSRRRAVVDAFLAASRGGDFEALLALLDPDVVLRADAAAVGAGASPEVRGAAGVARTFSGRAWVAVPALIDGAVGMVWAPGGRPRVAFAFTLRGDKVVAIDLVADPERLGRLDLVILEGRPRGHSADSGSAR